VHLADGRAWVGDRVQLVRHDMIGGDEQASSSTRVKSERSPLRTTLRQVSLKGGDKLCKNARGQQYVVHCLYWDATGEQASVLRNSELAPQAPRQAPKLADGDAGRGTAYTVLLKGLL
jgi:hypothetical protein